MTEVYFISQERYESYDQRLKPQERFTDFRLAEGGLKNLKCGKASLVVSPIKTMIDESLPPQFYMVLERELVK